MPRFRLTGNYGTFEITKIIEADDEDDAWIYTGIMADLEVEGWTFTGVPNGEEWTIEEITS